MNIRSLSLCMLLSLTACASLSTKPPTVLQAPAGMPSAIVTQLEQGNALFDAQKWAEAEEVYRQTIVAAPTFAEAHYNLATALYRAGNKVEAKKHYMEAGTLAPENKAIRDGAPFSLGLASAGTALAPAVGLAAALLRASKSTKADPAAFERNLKEVTLTSSIAMGALATALGIKDDADKMTKNAECIQSNSCGVKEAVDAVVATSAALNKDIAERKSKGVKLSTEATAQAQKAILPGLKIVPLWVEVILGGRAIAKNPMAAMQVVRFLPALLAAPQAMIGSFTMMKAAVDYLTFSGADSTVLDAALKDAEKDMAL